MKRRHTVSRILFSFFCRNVVLLILDTLYIQFFKHQKHKKTKKLKRDFENITQNNNGKIKLKKSGGLLSWKFCILRCDQC